MSSTPWGDETGRANYFQSGYNTLLEQNQRQNDEIESLRTENDQLREQAKPITGESSDGFHTFNELYHHRAVLFMTLCHIFWQRAWKSKKHHDGTMYPGMFIVGLNLPDGQATYHYDIDPYWDMFDVPVREAAPEWDGHTPTEAINRIQRFGRAIPETSTFTTIREGVEQLRAEVEQYRADITAGRLVRLPNELIAPYELNERYWICGWDADDCTFTIQDRVLKKEAARTALGKGEADGGC